MKTLAALCLIAAISATAPTAGAETSPLDDASIDLPQTDNLVTFKVQMKSGRTLTLKAREGSMISVTNGADVTLRLIVTRDAALGDRFVLRQVLAREKTIDGVVHPTLSVDRPVEFGSLSPDLEAAGVVSTSLVAVSKMASI